jgi:hypothetical protein
MALSNAVNTELAQKAIADLAWIRLYDSFPLSMVSKASGPTGMIHPAATTASTGTIASVAEAAAQAAEGTFQPTIQSLTSNLATYRASVTMSSELVADSQVYAFVADRLAGQIIEKVGATIVQSIRESLEAGSRYTEADHFDVGEVGLSAASKILDHSGFKCWSKLSNVYRSRAAWVFSESGVQNWGTQEGRQSLVTLGIRQEDYKYGRGIGTGSGGGGAGGKAWTPSSPYVAQGGGGGGGGPGPGEQEGGEINYSAQGNLERRSAALVTMTPTTDTYHTAYLGCPVYTSTGMAAAHNGEADAWAMLVDLSAWLHFDQPLTVRLDTESKLEKNLTVVHAAYRAAGKFMEPTAGWALVSPV